MVHQRTMLEIVAHEIQGIIADGVTLVQHT
jgi:hypothetical protein